MLITDAQVHIYEPSTPSQPWPKEAGRILPPAKHANQFTPEQMLGAMEAVGVDRAVIVPPVWSGDDNATALAAAARYHGRFAVMGRFNPYAKDGPEQLEHLLEEPNLLGLRMSGRWSTTSKEIQDAFKDPEIEWFWQSCEDLGLPLMLLTRQFISDVVPIVERHPRLTIIIDHLSAQGGKSLAESFATMDVLVALARHPCVYVKVGYAPNRSLQKFPFEDVHPYLRRLYEAFGAGRLLWEADITQLTKNTYDECLRLWQDGLPFLSDDEKEWILGRTAAEALNWPETIQSKNDSAKVAG